MRYVLVLISLLVPIQAIADTIVLPKDTTLIDGLREIERQRHEREMQGANMSTSERCRPRPRLQRRIK